MNNPPPRKLPLNKTRKPPTQAVLLPSALVLLLLLWQALRGKRFENYVKLQRETSYEGLNSRQLEEEKINRMFGGKGEMKRLMRAAKDRKGR